MKILHLAKSDSDGGAAQAGYRIHQGLVNLGIDSRMLVSNKMNTDARVMQTSPWVSKVAQKIDRAITVIAPRTTAGFRSAGAVGVCVRSTIEKINPDLLQLHWINRGFLNLDSLLNEKRPIVWRFADLWPVSGTEHYPEDTRRLEEGYRSENAVAGQHGIDFDRTIYQKKLRVYNSWKSFTVVAPSQWMAQMAAKSPLLKGRRIEVISTGQDLSLFFVSAREDKGELVLGFGAQDGIRDARKGFQLLLGALSQIQTKRPIHLVTFGSEISESELNDFANRSGVRVSSLGILKSKKQLQSAYSKMDWFFVPSVFENLANTAIEAMACGVPTVSFQVGGMPELIEHGQSGFLAGEPSEGGLVKVLKIIDSLSEEKAKSFRAKARKRVELKFSITAQAQGFKNLYEEILSQK